MSDRGSCKVFSPNIFNPTKCQNCYKPKEGHPSGPIPQTGSKFQRGLSQPVSKERSNTSPVKTLLKEGFLSVGTPSSDGNAVQDWVTRFYMLFTSGELEEFQVEDGQVLKEKAMSVIILRDFVRLVEGVIEIGEDHSLGLKSLKESVYLKAANRVEFENWWKELSSFVPSQMKRAFSASTSNRTSSANHNKQWLNRTFSSPQNVLVKSPLASQSLSTQQEASDTAQVDGLNSKISRLQTEVAKIPKLEEEKRKLELEVNYWKEYVTNSNASKKLGKKSEVEKDLNEARIQMISLQDKLNETENQLKLSIVAQNKCNRELNESRSNLEEANNMINIHKASINDLKTQLAQRKEINDKTDDAPLKPDVKPFTTFAEERSAGTLSPISDAPERGEASDFESKFFNLREKMKRIEKELFLKSKELEKANESRSKVAKYTRTLLQELEAKLNDTQRRMLEASERLSDTTMELELEREKRRRLESERDHSALSRHSSASSVVSNQDLGSVETQSDPMQISEVEVGNRYVEYYRSRFRESEGSLLEKDKKLSESETKFKELEAKYRNVLKQCRSLDDIQIKLSDATHKLSDRQLKIHELTRDVEKLRGYERSYDRKSKELQLSTDKVKNLAEQLSELRNKLSVQEHDIEGFKIREVVMKERLSALEEESSDEDDEEEQDDESRLERSIEAKERVEKTVNLEGQVRLLESENEKLNERIKKLEEDVEKSLQRGKTVDEKGDTLLEGLSEDTLGEEARELRDKVKELEEKLINEEDKFYSEFSTLKEKQKVEIENLLGSNRHEMQLFAKLKEDYQNLKKEIANKEEVMNVNEEEKERGGVASEEKLKDLENVIVDMRKQIADCTLKLTEFEGAVETKNGKIKCLEISVEKLNSEINDKSELLKELEDKAEESRQCFVNVTENRLQLQKLHEEESALLKNLETENAKLRGELGTMEKQMFAMNDMKYGNLSEETVDGEDGKNSVDAADVQLREELLKARQLLLKSQAAKTEYRNQLEETSRKYLESEQTVISLSQELESSKGMEKELSEEISAVQLKIETMRKQLSEAQESLQSKSLELEKDRNNFSHLVDVTSAYIKELENSLAESREKIEELENVVEESRITNGKRMPPDGTSGKERDDSVSDHSDVEGGISDKEVEIERDRLNSENERLTARLSSLESELAAVKRSLDLEKEAFVTFKRAHDVGESSKALVANGEENGSEEDLKASNLNRAKVEEIQKLTEYSESDHDNSTERINELEKVMEEMVRKHKEETKLKEDSHSKIVEEMKEEMERTITDAVKVLSASESDKKIEELEKEKEELRVRYEDELEAEKEAHQIEMEETIRDMLTVTEVFKSGKYNEKDDADEGDSHTSQRSSRRSSVISSEGMEEMRKDYEKKLAQKEQEWQRDLETMKQDMSMVIDALQHGGASTAILELTNKNQVLRRQLDEKMADFDVEREGLKMKIEKLESNNFFGLRRNEEMGSKIFQMQSELEEMEKKHKLELDVYQNKENSDAIQEVVKANETLEKKAKKLEADMTESRERSLEKMELMAMKIQEEKRVAVGEMTDTVLNLEAIIDEMKDKHELDIKDFEERSREEKLDALDKLQERIEDMEDILAQNKEDYEDKLIQQGEAHKREMQDLKEELETKAEYYKALSEERLDDAKNANNISDGDLQEKYDSLQKQLDESEKSLQKSIEELKSKHVLEMEDKQKNFENQVSEIRSEYEEKLKSCIKESARRHSVSNRKTESQKNKELSSKVMDLEMALEEQQKEFQAEVEDYKQVIENFQELVVELRGESRSKSESEERSEIEATSGDAEKKTNKRVEDLENQIKGFEKRIDYYKKKAERDEESENSRVNELQEEIHGFRKEMKHLTDSHSQESIQGIGSNPVLRRRSETSDPSGFKTENQSRHKRWSDLHLTDMVFTNEGIQPKRSTTDRDSWKRWSDLQLKQDQKLLTQIKRDEIAKTGSVARRKKLWEQGDENRPLKRPLSSIRP